MIVIPAIDIKGGRCVRLFQGDFEKETVYSDNPAEMGKQWVSQGATRLHVIDLDGANSGELKNIESVIQIKKATNVVVQLGGGLRKLASVAKAIEAGIDRVILGTVVFTDEELGRMIAVRFPGRVLVALDVKGGHVAIKGWKEELGLNLDEALKRVEGLGVKEIILTDISKDGTLEGIDVPFYQSLMAQTKLNIYASGGITSMKDIVDLMAIRCPGCIIGKALYEGQLDLEKVFIRVKEYVG